MSKYRVKDNFGELRLDRWLRKTFSSVPLSRIHKLLRSGKVLVNGKKAKGNLRIGPGDEIEAPLELEDRPAQKRRVEKWDLDIIYEDEHFLVLNKQSGIAVQPMSKLASISLLDHLRAYLSEQNLEVVYLVHRLDLNTTGALIVAKTHACSQLFTKMFKERKIEKTYLALAHGKFKQKSGEILLNLKKKEGFVHKPAVQKDGEKAITFYKVLEFNNDLSLVELKPHTGRMHQLRVHLQAITHPILGDPKYGDRSKDRLCFASKKKKRQILHAYRLAFIHPITNKQFTVKAPLARDFKEILQKNGFDLKRY